MGDGQFLIDGNLSVTLGGILPNRGSLLAKERFMDTLCARDGNSFSEEKGRTAGQLHHQDRGAEQAGAGTGRGRVLSPESLARQQWS